MCIRDSMNTPVSTGYSIAPFNNSEPTSRPSTSVSYTHLRAHETKANLVCRLLLEKKRRPPRSTQSRSSAASDVYKRQHEHAGQHRVLDRSVQQLRADEPSIYVGENLLGDATDSVQGLDVVVAEMAELPAPETRHALGLQRIAGGQKQRREREHQPRRAAARPEPRLGRFGVYGSSPGDFLRPFPPPPPPPPLPGGVAVGSGEGVGGLSVGSGSGSSSSSSASSSSSSSSSGFSFSGFSGGGGGVLITVPDSIPSSKYSTGKPPISIAWAMNAPHMGAGLTGAPPPLTSYPCTGRQRSVSVQ